jgi:hypothetical protein
MFVCAHSYDTVCASLSHYVHVSGDNLHNDNDTDDDDDDEPVAKKARVPRNAATSRQRQTLTSKRSGMTLLLLLCASATHIIYMQDGAAVM